jgi:hypothetical protein
MKLEGEARGADEDLLSGSGGPPVHLTDRPLNILATAWVFHGVTNTFDGVANTFDGVTATLPPGRTDLRNTEPVSANVDSGGYGH